MRKRSVLLFLTALVICFTKFPTIANAVQNNEFQVHPNFSQYRLKTIAVLPMDNYSLEPDVEQDLFDEIYKRLAAKGYRKIAKGHTREVMTQFGIQTPGQIEGVSLVKLCTALSSDALLLGEINQSAAIHEGVYEALVVSCSLRLRSCSDGTTLWETEQWRTAHRQWNLDPFNMLINSVQHEKASRKQRIAFLVDQMLQTLPQGPVRLTFDPLLQKALDINATTD